jgi:hypothetical protein
MSLLVAKHGEIIYEYFQEMSQKIFENVHHQPLERSGCVA